MVALFDADRGVELLEVADSNLARKGRWVGLAGYCRKLVVAGEMY